MTEGHTALIPIRQAKMKNTMIYEDLKGKKVLVTGSSSGIGSATAIMFSRQGCFVGVHYFKTKTGGKKTLEQVKKNSDGVLLLNNAGSLIDRQPFETATIDYHDDVYATNVRSVFLATSSALPYLKKSKGNIVNIGSVAGHTGGGPGSGIYSGAKAAVATETISMAKEFAKYGIRVNSVLPGLIETRFHR